MQRRQLSQGGCCECEPPNHEPCAEANPGDAVKALGLSCDGESQLNTTSWGSHMAFGTIASFGDMFFTWIESKEWTGNISFDDNGNPIAINAGAMDDLNGDGDGDADGFDPITGENIPPDCPIGTGCAAPEQLNTCMDLSDSILDSYALRDNFQRGCDGEQPPMVIPSDLL